MLEIKWWKRISNGKLVNLQVPIYTKQDGIYGYLIETNDKIYFICSIDDKTHCDEVTQDFEKQQILN
jgi:hypothetical protein